MLDNQERTELLELYYFYSRLYSENSLVGISPRHGDGNPGAIQIKWYEMHKFGALEDWKIYDRRSGEYEFIDAEILADETGVKFIALMRENEYEQFLEMKEKSEHFEDNDDVDFAALGM